ncbi:MAG: type II secretion system protein GspM [Pseudomonadota bacterium]
MKQNRKFLAITLPFTLILLCLVFYEYGFLKLKNEQASIEETKAFKLKSLKKYMAMVAQKPQLEKSLIRLKEIRQVDNSKIIEGQTIALAAASLQNTIKGIITARSGTIYSLRVERPDEYNNFRMINIAIDMSMPDTRALSDTIYAIETQTPYLIIREFDARVKNYRVPKELIVKLKVSAITAAK